MTGYVVGKWNGLPLYNCEMCPFDTLVESEMLRHIAGHQAPPEPEMVVVQVFDRFGNVVETETVEVVVDAPVEVRPVKKQKGGTDAANNAD